MSSTILIKPIISEKSETLTDDLNQYTFMVAKTANKVEIRKAVEKMYGVSVDSVNTLRTPGKAKSRNTKSGVVKGKVSSYKKAIVKLSEGEEINFFGDV
ncbi:MAG: 50S ribosomal protein L23 [Flavobacteriales bacterium]|nr:50S ribosomal protein L23 [Flavobacteriales bacterium]